MKRHNPATAGSPPHPVDLAHLRPKNGQGLLAVSSCIGFTVVGITMSAAGGIYWPVGQVLFAFAMVQWFAVLHECGHETLFKTRWLHAALGHVAAYFSIIPFRSWKRVHARHHKWTGWQDVDPTTQALVPRELKAGERALVNFCWRFWVPLFSVLYRLNNFWDVRRLYSLFKPPAERVRLTVGMLGMATAYAVTIALVGAGQVLQIAGLALVLALIAEDVLLLSQHTHIPQKLSHGDPVRAFPTIEQEVFTRSLVCPGWLSKLLLHIDAHELHHMYPFVPSYHLPEIQYEPGEEVDFWTWTRRARKIPGEVFLFQNRLESGADV